MASRTETLLFLVDVQVKGQNALRELDAAFDAAAARQERRLLALNEAANGEGNGGAKSTVAAAAVPRENGARGVAAVPAPGGGQQGNGASNAVVGIRGPREPGSRTNPIIFAQESGEAAGLGSLAAQTGDAARGEPAPRVSPTARQVSPEEKQLLSAAADMIGRERDRQGVLFTGAELARLASGNGGGPNQLSLFGITPSGSPAADRAASAAAAVAAARETAARAHEQVGAVVAAMQASQQASARQSLAAALATTLAGRVAQMPARPRTLTVAETAGRLGMSADRVRFLAGSGQLPGAVKQGGAWQIPEQAVIDMAAASSGEGGGGGPVVPVVARGGGGGGRGRGGLMAALGFGGLFGLAGFGTLASFAGFGPEHAIMTGVGLAGSLASAGVGAGALGAGALGTIGVGAGSDLAVMASTASDVRLLSKDMTALSQATAVYGRNSTQAAQAQKQLNFDIKDTLAGTPGVYAELALAKQLNALNALWDKTTSHARVLAVQIGQQAVGLARDYMPLVVSAAQRNLAIIDNDIRPLFAWLEGPQGVQIWKDLENQFATQLPTAIHAATQGIELLLRIVDLASQYTGTFTRSLDHLFTRLNGLNNVQLGQWVGRMVGDFRLWETFVKALVVDLARLFSNDAHTGNSIIAELTVMLQKLGEWEQTVAGRQSLMTIFEVHKQQIDALLKLLPLFVRAFAPLYMTVAPAVTSAFTAVLKVFEALAGAIEKLPLGNLAVGLLLVSGGIGKLGALAGMGPLGALLGRGGTGGGLVGKGEQLVVKDAEGNVTGTIAADAASGGILSRILGLGARTSVGRAIGTGLGDRAAMLAAGSLGSEGIGSLLAGGAGVAGMAAAPFLAGALPVLGAAAAAAGLGYVISQLVSSSGSAPASTVTGGQLATILQRYGVAGLRHAGGVSTQPISPRIPLSLQPKRTVSVEQMGQTPAAKAALAQFNAIAGSATGLSHETVGGLQGLLREGQALLTLFPQDASVIKRDTASIRADLGGLDGVWDTINQRWSASVGAGMATLLDVFKTNTNLIAHQIGLSSANGRQAMARNIQGMISDTVSSILFGAVGVKRGMDAINAAIAQGTKDGALTWQRASDLELSALDTLHAHGQLSTRSYYANVLALTDSGLSKIEASNRAHGDAINAYLKQQEADGSLLHSTYLQKRHQMDATANQQAAIDAAGFVSTILTSMQRSGQVTGAGMQTIVREVDAALKGFKAAQIPVPAILEMASGDLGPALRATGGLVDRPMFIAGEEAPAHPEIVLATNPAYRQRNVGLWMLAGHRLGIPGFASGGIATPSIEGGGELGILSRAGVAQAVHAADAYLAKREAAMSAHGMTGFPVHVSGSLAGWLQSGMSLAGVSGGAWLAMLERQAMRESTGNPDAVNGWDINAQRGDPSEGLLQTTLSTFASYAVPGHDNILNPVDNTAAAIRYMIARYGHGSSAAALAFMIANGGNAYARGGIVGRHRRGAVAHAASRAYWGWNPIAKKFQRHTQAQWNQIHAQARNAKRRAAHRPIAPSGRPYPEPQSTIFTSLGQTLSTATVGKVLAGEISGEQTNTQNATSLVTALTSLEPGTNLAALGIPLSALSSSLVSPANIGQLIAGGPAADAAQVQIANREIDQYKDIQTRLKASYQAALQTHHKTLAKTLLGELTTVDQAIVTTTAQAQQALVKQITDTAQRFTDRATSIGGAVSILSAIEGLAPTDSLAALGLSPAILQTLGLGGVAGIGSLVGTGVSYLQGLASSQPGGLTASQLADAKSGTAALNSLIASEEAPLEQGLAYYESQLPNLHGSDLQNALNAMQQLAAQLIGLKSSIDTNTTSLSSLTSATTANTTATQAMTGTVAYSFQGQTYLASLSSDTTVNLGVGS